MSATDPSPVTRIEPHHTHKEIPAWLIVLLATSCGLIVANNYYAQPLAGPISRALGMPPSASGLIVTMTQIGYALGLLFVVPLGDLIENRKLVTSLVGLSAVGLILAGISNHPAPFLAAATFTGVGTVAVQVLVPYASHLAPPGSRGRVVGNVMSGLMLGIMLARPVSSFITQFSSWHVVFFMSATVMAILGVVLRLSLPPRSHATKVKYTELLGSMVRLARNTPVLRRRALYQASLFGAFSLFWTTSPLLLAGPAYRMSQGGIALFALAGVAGAISAPIAGRVADAGWTRLATAVAMVCVAASFLMTHFLSHGSPFALGVMVLSGILLDFGVAGNLTLSQREIFMLGAQYRSRLNALFMTTFFISGALCSAVGGWTFAHGGWPLTSLVGFALPIASLAYWATERSPSITHENLEPALMTE